jgi:hypothetical protein
MQAQHHHVGGIELPRHALETSSVKSNWSTTGLSAKIAQGRESEQFFLDT